MAFSRGVGVVGVRALEAEAASLSEAAELAGASWGSVT